MSGFANVYIDFGFNWITICPRSFQVYPTVSNIRPGQDISASAPNTVIDAIRPLGTLLFHEFLHILYDEDSK